MLTTEQRTAKIAQLAAFPPVLRQAVEGLTDEQLDTPYRDGGWTPRQVVHHLVDSHANAYLRFRWIVSDDNPTIKTYDQDAWAKLPDMSLPLEPSLATLDGLHQRWSKFLAMLPEEAWTRSGEHPDNGRMTLDDFLNMYSAHGAKHAKQITDLRDRKGW
jgi:hypothetical protein